MHRYEFAGIKLGNIKSGKYKRISFKQIENIITLKIKLDLDFVYKKYYIIRLFERGESKQMIIAIDGLAGSGKSSTSKLVAKKLGFCHFSTGKCIEL